MYKAIYKITQDENTIDVIIDVDAESEAEATELARAELDRRLEAVGEVDSVELVSIG